VWLFLVICILYSDCFFLSCKANARLKLAKTGHGRHSSTLVCICVVQLLFVLFYVLFVCKCVLYYCYRVATQLQLINISYHIKLLGGHVASVGPKGRDIIFLHKSSNHQTTRCHTQEDCCFAHRLYAP
jgi:hypothetical protein